MKQPPKNSKPFVKGDKRINRKGRPKSHDVLHQAIQRIGAEIVTSKDGKSSRMRLDVLLLQMFQSDDPAAWRLLLEHGWGKPPEQVDVTSGGEKLRGSGNTLNAAILTTAERLERLGALFDAARRRAPETPSPSDGSDTS